MSSSEAQHWNRLMRWRTECHKRFGGVLDYPVVQLHAVLNALLKPGMRVLDVGAGAHQPFRGAITKVTPHYFSLDTDPDGTFDFRSFEDVPSGETFDLILANQVIEHLTVDDAFALVRAAFGVTSQNGVFFATVPNAAHPVRQRDCTHITAWPSNDLYSLVRSAGYDVESVARYNKTPLTDNFVKKWIVQTVCKEFRMDWCDSIVVAARKRNGDRER